MILLKGSGACAEKAYLLNRARPSASHASIIMGN